MCSLMYQKNAFHAYENLTVDYEGHDPVTFTMKSVLASPHKNEISYGAHIEGTRVIIPGFIQHNSV